MPTQPKVRTSPLASSKSHAHTAGAVAGPSSLRKKRSCVADLALLDYIDGHLPVYLTSLTVISDRRVCINESSFSTYTKSSLVVQMDKGRPLPAAPGATAERLSQW